jgi:pyruvate/2-oxoglutarate/acetoin dehydrogenase E1 component
MPSDWEGIASLVKSTNKAIVAHEDTLTCGFGAEIAARIGDELFEFSMLRSSASRRWIAWWPTAPTSKRSCRSRQMSWQRSRKLAAY